MTDYPNVVSKLGLVELPPDQSFFRRITPNQLRAEGTDTSLQYLKKQAVALKAFAGEEEEVNLDNYNVVLYYKDTDGDLTIIHTVEDLVSALAEYTDVGKMKILAHVHEKPPPANTGLRRGRMNTNETLGRVGAPTEQYAIPQNDNASDGPLQIVVQGAGISAVDGTYSRQRLFFNAWRYTKRGRWNEKDCTFYIVQWRSSGEHCRHWFISIVPDGKKPGTAADIDFYQTPVQDDCLRIPPKTGWVKTKRGKRPSPVLTFLSTNDLRTAPGLSSKKT